MWSSRLPLLVVTTALSARAPAFILKATATAALPPKLIDRGSTLMV